MDIINENDLSFCSKSDIECILVKMDEIEIYLKKIKLIRLLKPRVNEMVDNCLLHIRYS